MLFPQAAAHGEGNELFARAEKLIMPYVGSPPTIDGSLGAREYDPYGLWEEADVGFQVALAHNDTAVFVGLRQPGEGWVGFATSSDSDAGANVIVATMGNATPRISDNYARNVTDEMENVPDTSVGGTYDVLGFAATATAGNATYEFAIPMADADPHDQALEAGTLYPLVLAFNETSLTLPAALSEGDVHIFQVYVARATDDLAAIRDMFMASPTPAPALGAMALLSLATATLAVTYLRRGGKDGSG